MFAATWREHWGLQRDPFVCEDADKDLILSKIDARSVHSSFDRIFGETSEPSPGIVFGEKGSGKSGLRLMMRRRLESQNGAGGRAFHIEYVDFNGYIEEAARSMLGRTPDSAAAADVVARWELADHLDAILSLATTKLVDTSTDAGAHPPKLSPKQKHDLQLLTALYYRSTQRTAAEALVGLRAAVHARKPGWITRAAGSLGLNLLGLAVIVLPFVVTRFALFEGMEGLSDFKLPALIVGGLIAAAPWIDDLFRGSWQRRRARKRANAAVRHVRVLSKDAEPLAGILAGLSEREIGEFALPTDSSAATRYDLLGRFLDLLDTHGYRGMYVLVDRVDEPTLLSGRDEAMRQFVARLLDIKLLQHPNLALKLFLPIEMESLWRNASPEQLKRMRLDKSNLIPELKWSGRELYEIANRRLSCCLAPGDERSLSDLFAEDLEVDYVLDTLSALGTPRYAFAFLSDAFLQYLKNLPDDLPGEDPRWRLPRAAFDVTRSAWIDRAGILRRTLN